MAEETKPAPTVDRRTVLRATALGVAVAGVGATAAACSSSNSMPQGSNAQTVAGGASAGTTLTTTADVPVGSGFINNDAAVVVTQPESGTYKAFSSICTHAQCPVTSVTNNVIQCPCHGSQYSAKDGSVITGPATRALAPKNITVKGSDIILES